MSLQFPSEDAGISQPFVLWCQLLIDILRVRQDAHAGRGFRSKFLGEKSKTWAIRSAGLIMVEVMWLRSQGGGDGLLSQRVLSVAVTVVSGGVLEPQGRAYFFPMTL